MKKNGSMIGKGIAWLLLVSMGVNCFGGSVPAGEVVFASQQEEHLAEEDGSQTKPDETHVKEEGEKEADPEQAADGQSLTDDASKQAAEEREKNGIVEEETLESKLAGEKAAYEAKTISTITRLTEDMEVGDLTVNNALYLDGHELTVHGNLYLNKELNLNEGYLHIKGDLTEGYYGRIGMNSHNDFIMIEGDYRYYNGGSGYKAANGTVEILGDIIKADENTQGSTGRIFDSSCKVVLSGGQKQTIDLMPESLWRINHIVIENTSGEGVFSKHALNCDKIEDEGDKLYFEASGSNGEVLLEDQTIEGDYTLLSGELDLAGHTLTVLGNFIHAGGRVNVNGGSLVVEGDYKKQYLYEMDGQQVTEQSAGRLFMNKEQDYVLIKGDYVDSGVNSTEEDLTAGTLELKGSMRADDALSHPLFCATENHTVKLTGTGKQMISRGEKYSGSYIRFANLVVAQEAAGSTVFESTVQVCGKVRHETTLITGTTRLDGATPEGNRLYGDVELSGNMNLDRDYVFSGDVYTEDSCMVMAKDSHVTVEGNFYQNNGTLAANGENGVFTIRGDYVARGNGQHFISSGTIELEGDMVRENGYVVATKNAELVFTGTKEQHIALSHASTRLENIVVDNPAGVVVSDNVTVINVACRQGVLSYASGGIHGFTVEEDGVYEGDLVIAGGILDLNGHSYHVRGNLIIQNGVLKMTNEQDYLLVDGDFETDSAISHSGYLTAGTMELKGDFTQKGNSSSFQALMQHTVVFSGDAAQSISFEGSASNFVHLKLDNKEKVVFSTVVNASGTITQNCPVEGTLGMGNTTVFEGNAYQGDVSLIQNITLKNDISIDGDVYMESRTLDLGNSRMAVSGTLMATYSYIYIAKGSLHCGNLHMKNNCNFSMNDPAARVTVEGDIYFFSRYSQSLKAGTIEVGGDVTFNNNAAWSFYEDVDVILNGSGKQTVTMTGSQHTLGNLILQNTSEEGVYVSNYLICQSIDNTAGTKVTFADGGILGYTLEEDKVIEGDLILSGGEMDLNGHTLTVKGDLIQGDADMNINGGCLDIQGDYYIAKRTERSDGTYAYTAAGAKLTMTRETERIIVHQNLYTAFTNAGNLKCSGGVIELLGDFRMLSGYFSMGQDSTVLFSGKERQKITVSGYIAQFGGLIISNEKGIDNATYIYVNGTLQTNGYPVGGAIYCQSGTTMLDDFICANLSFQGSIPLQKDIRVKGNVNLGKLDLNGHHLTVEGDCTLNSDANISQPDGILEIKGNINSSTTCYNGFGTNQVILSGDTKQTIADSGMKFCFQELVIHNTSKEGVYAAGLFDAETVTDPEHKLTFFTEGEAGYTLTKDTVISGNFTQLLGTMDLNGHTLTVMGDYIQKNGMIRLSGGRLNVYGNYTLGNLDAQGNYTVNHARLSMNREEDFVYVGGNVTLASGLSLANDMEQGTFEVKGNVSYNSKADSYLPEDVIFVFSGEKKQSLSKGTYDLRFGTMQLANTSAEGVILISNYTIHNPVTGNGKLNSSSGTTVWWINGQAFPFTDWAGNLYLNGKGVTMERDLNVKGQISIDSPLDMNGNHLTADSIVLRSTLNPDGGVLQVHNNLTVSSYSSSSSFGNLQMQNEADVVQVSGDMTAQTGTLDLSAGTLEIKGNVNISGASVTAGEKHNTILSGKMNARGDAYTQNITFAASKRVGILTLTKPREYYVFNRDVEDMCQSLLEDIQDITAPTAPAGLEIFDVSYTKLTLSWDASTDDTGVAGYDIYRNDRKIMTVSGTSYTDRYLMPDTQYSYYVVAKDATLNTSAFSKAVSVTTLKDETVPAVPQGIWLSERFANALTIHWEASPDNVKTKGYHIYRDGVLIKDTEDTVYTDSGLEANTHYIYQLTAYDTSGNESELSEEYSFYTQAVEIAEMSPKNYAKLSGTKANFTVSFVNAGSTSGYQVYMAYREGEDGEYKELLNTTAGKIPPIAGRLRHRQS